MAESFDVVECGNTDAVLNAAWSEAVPPQPPLEPATFSFESNERSSWRLPSYSRITPCFCHISRVDIFPRAKAIKLEGERRLVDTDRKSTRLNSSHLGISYAVFCLKKKKNPGTNPILYHGQFLPTTLTEL